MGTHGKARIADGAATLLRLALSASFLSAVADRFGLWGSPGAPAVAWGDFAHFTTYTRQLTNMLPAGLAPTFAWIATILETVFGVGLLLGWQTRLVAGLSAALLLSFALAMTVALGVKAPLDYSVFSAAAGALVLASSENVGFGIDRRRSPR